MIPDPRFLFAGLILTWGVFSFTAISFEKGFLFFTYIACFIAGCYLIQVKAAPSIHLKSLDPLFQKEKLLISGRVASFAKQSESRTRYTIQLTRYTKEAATVQVNGRIYLNIYGILPHPLRYMDQVTFYSRLKPFHNFNNPGGFDYERYMQFKGILASSGISPKALVDHQPPASCTGMTRFIRWVQGYRFDYLALVDQCIESGRVKAIFSALCIGKKDMIDQDLRDTFSKSGTSHLLAISGLHLSIVSLLFYLLFNRLLSFSSRLLISGFATRIASLLTLIPVMIYAILSGFSPSTQRALCMIVLVMLSRAIERDSCVINSLAFAGVLILLTDPSALFSISFQLSFIAVTFIIIGMSFVDYSKWRDRPKIISFTFMLFMVSVWAGLGTAPLVVHYFGLVATIQVMVNMIMVPIVGFFALPAGLLSLLVFKWTVSLSKVLIFLSSYLLDISIHLLDVIVQIPFSWVRIGMTTGFETFIVYLLITAGVLLAVKIRFQGILLGATALLMILFDTGFWLKDRYLREDLGIQVFDVGQGSSSLILLPGSKRMLVDGGGFPYISSFDTGRHLIAPFLWKNKIRTLDAVILSHPQADHMNGLVFILENFRVKTLIKNHDTGTAQTYERLIHAAKKQDTKILTIPVQGHQYRVDEAVLDFLGHSCTGDDKNDNSLVFRLEYHAFSVLFTGDIHKRREGCLVSSEAGGLASQILLSPHHGSASSSSDFFLDKVNPESVIISCGWKNRYGFPHKSVLRRYRKKEARVFRTDIHGAVYIETNGSEYHVTIQED
ncbi:MAG: DNA internalization-related competence protein ComEC/Rec2 [Desulfobacteraceae bacterium]|nr:MAG: DNA internalization-related competence protein ComEC/Rec2 [Desulfobacteraceae bacterium]